MPGGEGTQGTPARIRALSRDSVPRPFQAFGGPIARLLVELDLQTGLRWGELTELRGGDVIDDAHHDDRAYLRVERAVAGIGAVDNPLANGGRFYVEDTTKGGTYAHGTRTAYLCAPCRCLWCRRAFATYRAERRTRLYASAHAWANDTATDLTIEAIRSDGEQVEVTTRVAEPGPLIAMKPQAVMSRSVISTSSLSSCWQHANVGGSH